MAAEDEGRPPGFRTWRGMYGLVLGTLAALIAALAALAHVYR